MFARGLESMEKLKISISEFSGSQCLKIYFKKIEFIKISSLIMANSSHLSQTVLFLVFFSENVSIPINLLTDSNL